MTDQKMLIPTSVKFEKFAMPKRELGVYGNAYMTGIYFESIEKFSNGKTKYRLTATDSRRMFIQEYEEYLPDKLVEFFDKKTLHPEIFKLTKSAFNEGIDLANYVITPKSGRYPAIDVVVDQYYEKYNNPEMKHVRVGFLVENLSLVLSALKKNSCIWFDMLFSPDEDVVDNMVYVKKHISFGNNDDSNEPHLGLIMPLRNPQLYVPQHIKFTKVIPEEPKAEPEQSQDATQDEPKKTRLIRIKKK